MDRFQSGFDQTWLGRCSNGPIGRIQITSSAASSGPIIQVDPIDPVIVNPGPIIFHVPIDPVLVNPGRPIIVIRTDPVLTDPRGMDRIVSSIRPVGLEVF